jgi:hypothetical protein
MEFAGKVRVTTVSQERLEVESGRKLIKDDKISITLHMVPD